MVGITLLTYILSKIASSLYAGGILLDVILGLGMWTSVPALILATGVYTGVGGLHAVLWTDAVQMCIFLVGGVVGMGVALGKVGGQGGLFQTLRSEGLGHMTHLFRQPNDRGG